MTIAVISMIRDPWGGSEELWYQMAKAARNVGVEVIHVGYEQPQKHFKLLELEGLGVKHIDRPGWIPPSALGLNLTLYLGRNFIRKKLASPIKKLFRLKPDLVLYNGTCYSVAAEKELIHWIKRTQTPFFILGELNDETIRHITMAQTARIIEAYRLCRKVFFVSERNLGVAERHLCCKIPNGLVVRNPVNLTSLKSIPFIATDGVIQMALVGNLVTVHKGQDILLEALAKTTLHRRWVLNIYGKGYDQEYLQKLAAFLQIDDKVIFHGTVKDVREIWKKNHVLLMPSHIEGMPLALVEAMICGRVCIGTDVGGIGEWITDGTDGFLAESPTVAALAKALQHAFKNLEDWPQIGAAAHNKATGLLDPEAGKTLLRLMADPLKIS